MTKADLRTEIKKRLAAHSPADLKQQSDTICSKIISSPDYIFCTTLLAYMPLSDEVDITPVVSDALNHNKQVFIPRITPGTNQMEFYRYDTTTQTASGSFGILEPAQNEANSFTRFLTTSTSSQRILILVPGRAFTLSGKRLGRGKGFYDIYFSKLAGRWTLPSDAHAYSLNIKKSGVSFACQIVADIPTTPDDIIMDNVFSGQA